MIWYLAHPYSVKNPDGTEDMEKHEENVKKCIEVANNLMDLGYLIYCPIVMTHWLHKAKQRNYEEWIALDMEIMEKMDGLILAPNWEKSKGCIKEKEYFEFNKKPILYYNNILRECS